MPRPGEPPPGANAVADIAVRAALQDEAGLLSSLHRAAFEAGPPGQEVWSPEVMGQLLRMPGSQALIAELKGQARGFLLLRQAADEGEILTLAVVPAVRRRGNGAALVGAALGLCAGGGIRRLFLEVADDNFAARALYRSLGFTQAGYRKAYYKRTKGPFANAFVLEKIVKN